MELSWSNEELHFHLDADVILTLSFNELSEGNILLELEKAHQDPKRRQNVLRAIQEFGQWASMNKEVLEAEYSTYAKTARALIRLIEGKAWHEYTLENRQIRTRFCYEITLERTAEQRIIVGFWIKPDDRKLRVPTLKVQLTRRLRDRRGCRNSYNAQLRQICKDEKDDKGRKDLQDIISTLPDFFKGIEPLTKEGQYLREFCLTILALSDDEPIVQSALQNEVELESQIREFLVLSIEDFDGFKKVLDGYLQWEEADYTRRQQALLRILQKRAWSPVSRKLYWQTAMLCTEYFLSAYDFKCAAQALHLALHYLDPEQGSSAISRLEQYVENFLLRLPVLLFTKSKVIALWFLLIIFIITSPAILPTLSVQLSSHASIQYFFGLSTVQNAFKIINLVFLLTLYSFFFAIPLVVLFKSARDRLPYFQLYFPRLFSAIVAGFAVLVFDNTSWSMGVNISLLSLVLFTALALLASRGYLLYDAQSVSLSARNLNWEDVMDAAARIFWIGLIQSVAVAIVISSLLSSTVQLDGQRGVEIATLSIYPTLIAFWASIALFIGAFVQLLWQGTRVTEPV